MSKYTANGPGDFLVTEMIQEMPMELLCVITEWFEGQMLGECDAALGVLYSWYSCGSWM